MNSQRDSRTLDGGIHCLLYRRALSLGPEAGHVTVVEGVAWLTRKDDVTDYFLEAGEMLRLEEGDTAVIESASRGAPVTFRWMPAAQAGQLYVPRAFAHPLLAQE
jgi:hypothetical protein